MALISESGFNIFVEKINGAEIIIKDNGVYNFQIATLSINKKKLQKDNLTSLTLSTIADLASSVDTSVPFSLCLTGKGVVTRKIQTSAEDTDQNILSRIFPNAILSDFAIQRYDIDNTNAFISIIRKEILNALLQDCKKNGLNIIHCSLGPFSIQSILSLLETGPSQNLNGLSFGSFDIAIENGRIANIAQIQAPAEISISLSGIECPSSFLLSFASAFSYLSDPDDLMLSVPEIVNSRSEYTYKKKVLKVSIVYLFIIFGLLLINFILFSFINDKNKGIQTQVALDSATISMLDKLKKQLADRESFFSQNGISSSTRTSFYADRIAASLPAPLSLTQLNISPARIDDDSKKILYQASVIRIQGQTQYSIEVNEWMKTLKKMDWVKEATLVNYKQEPSKNTGIFDIELKLN